MTKPPSISPPELSAIAAQMTAQIHLTIPRDAMREMIGPAIQEVFAAVQNQGLIPTGAWFTHHLRRPTETFDFKVCVPVSAPLQPVGRVAAGQLPAAARAASTVYSGPYEGLAAAWPQLFAWVAAQGLTPAGDLLEVYLTGPAASADPADWQTQLKLTLL
jgi:effector-binding domain-containing protein